MAKTFFLYDSQFETSQLKFLFKYKNPLNISFETV